MDLSAPLSEALDPELWRERFAWGLNLGGGQKDAIAAVPDRVLSFHLRSAASELSMKLGVSLKVERLVAEPLDEGAIKGVDYDRVIPRLPWSATQHRAYYRIDLCTPVISVQRIRCYQLNQQVLSFDSSNSRIVIEHPQQGIIHLIPLSLPFVSMVGQLDQFFLHRPPFVSSIEGPLPDFWAVDYTTGPISIGDSEPGHIDLRLVSWIYAKAALVVLPLAASGLSGGVTSHTASMDGVSRTINLNPDGMHAIAVKAFREMDDAINWKDLRAAVRPSYFL